MKKLVGKNLTKTVDFMDDTVEIKQLSVKAVMALQEDLKDAESVEGLETISKIIRIGVVDADELTEDEMQDFPLGALVELAHQVMDYAGIKAESGNA